MKKIIFIFVCCLLIFIPAAFAQQGNLLWELDGEFTVTDLKFTFDIPSSWLYSADNGIAFAATEEDLDALLDDDESTQPEGYTMRLVVFAWDDLGLDEDATLDDAAELVMDAGNIEVADTFELPVMVYRSVVMAGVNESGRAGAASFWKQDGALVIFSFGSPERELSADALYTWGHILGSVTALLPEGVEVEETAFQEWGIGLYTPADWDTESSESGLAFHSENASIEVTVETLEELNLEEDATFEDVQELLGSLVEQLIEFGYEVSDEGAFIINEQPGVGIKLVEPETGEVQYVIVTMGTNNFVISYVLSVSDQETFETLKPLFILMLQSITRLE